MSEQEHDFDEQALRGEVVEDDPEEVDLDDDDLDDDDGGEEEDEPGAEGGNMSEPTERVIVSGSAGKVDDEIDQTFPASDPPANY